MSTLPSIKFLLAAASFAAVPSHEVSTHAEITRRAVHPVTGSVRLSAVLAELQLEQADYSGHFPWPQLERMQGESIDAFVMPRTAGARELIVAGSILEDDKLRFLNHFFDPTTGRGLSVSGLQPSFPATVWATTQPRNRFSLVSALDSFHRGFTISDPVERDAERALMFRSLGHIAHLLQDMSQPSHARDDDHAGRHVKEATLGIFPKFSGSSALEDWEVWHLNQWSWDSVVQQSSSYWDPLPFATVRDYIIDMAVYASEHWFSDDTVFAPARSPTTMDVQPPLTVVQGVERYVSSATHNGVIDRDAGARMAQAGIGAIVGGAYVQNPKRYSLDSYDNSIVRTNAAYLANRAIAQTEALVDHFFRGQLLLGTSCEGTS